MYVKIASYGWQMVPCEALGSFYHEHDDEWPWTVVFKGFFFLFRMISKKKMKIARRSRKMMRKWKKSRRKVLYRKRKEVLMNAWRSVRNQLKLRIEVDKAKNLFCFLQNIWFCGFFIVSSVNRLTVIDISHNNVVLDLLIVNCAPRAYSMNEKKTNI